MKRTLIVIILALAWAGPAAGLGLFEKKGPDEQREKLQNQRQAALTQLYAERPDARDKLKAAKGYAVFSNIGINLFLVSTERGGGILRDNRTGKDTYMNMFSAGGGVGMGVKDFSLIFVFHTTAALEEFRISGWDFSGQADATAESGDKGVGAEGAGTIMPGTTIYQMTEAGLALQATLKGTKFWADEDLN